MALNLSELKTTVIPTTSKVPKMTVIYPKVEEHCNTSCLIIFPGGGYRKVMIDHEGLEIGRYFARQGIICFVVHYQVGSKSCKSPIRASDARPSIRDGINALAHIRKKECQRMTFDHGGKTERYNLSKIGIIGFSAGGHLALSVIKHDHKTLHEGHYPPVASLLLVYPTLRNPCCWCIAGGTWLVPSFVGETWSIEGKGNQHAYCYATDEALDRLVTCLDGIPVMCVTTSSDLLLPTFKHGGRLVDRIKKKKNQNQNQPLEVYHVHGKWKLFGRGHGHGIVPYWSSMASKWIHRVLIAKSNSDDNINNVMNVATVAAAIPSLENSNRQRFVSMNMAKYGILIPIVFWILWESMAKFTTIGCVLCKKWERFDEMMYPINLNKNNNWMSKVPKCPCTVKEVIEMADVFLEDKVPSLHQPCTATYNKSGCTATSYRTIFPANNGAGNQCCYDINGALITNGLSAGTIDRYSPSSIMGVVGHFTHDVLPFFSCCNLCRENCEVCDLYLNRRPLFGDVGCLSVNSDHVC